MRSRSCWIIHNQNKLCLPHRLGSGEKELFANSPSKFIFIITIENLIIKTDWEQLIQFKEALFVGSKTFVCLL